MRWIVAALLMLGLALYGGYIFVKGYPYRLYSNWSQGKEWNKWYAIDDYKSLWLTPSALEDIPSYKEDYGQLWKEFPLRNAMVPLPVRHPLFQTVPLIQKTMNKRPPQVGVIILNPAGRELSRVYTLPMSIMEDSSQGQDLFKLPFVRNRILKYDNEKLWKDLFTMKIEVGSKSLDAMIYDLFILNLRSKILPKETTRFGLLEDSRALIELLSKDRDYQVELILTNVNGNLYSYLLRTEKNNAESQKLRSKFLAGITFRPVDPAMGRILYKEFKQLNFARQVDSEGMLYLFSAWTQEMENADLLKEMIFYLERGRNRSAQLNALYTYALANFGKTFTTRETNGADEDQNITLQRKIELEDIEKMKDAARDKEKPPVEPELTAEEKMNLYLKKAKENSAPVEKSDMTIH